MYSSCCKEEEKDRFAMSATKLSNADSPAKEVKNSTHFLSLHEILDEHPNVAESLLLTSRESWQCSEEEMKRQENDHEAYKSSSK